MRNLFQNRFRYLRQHGLKAYVFALSKRAGGFGGRMLDKSLRAVLGQRYLDFRSRRFWAGAKDSYLASDAYYDQQEAALREMLSSISSSTGYAIDVGCADGRFTLVIAERYDRTVGLDISKELVRKARMKAAQRKTNPVEFEQVDLTKIFPDGEYDLVSCMGVTSAVIGEDAFKTFIANLYNATRAGGVLITKDSLSSGEYWEKMNGPYVAVYRNEAAYMNHFAGLGLKLAKKIELARSKRLVNYICLWEKRSAD